MDFPEYEKIVDESKHVKEYNLRSDLFEAFKILEKSSSDLLRKRLDGCVAEVDENGVVHLVNKDGQVVMMMTQTDYQALLKYQPQWLNGELHE